MLLRAPGIDVNRGDSVGRTPLHMASLGGHVQEVKTLLQTPGIGVNHANGGGVTSLHIASVEGHLDVVLALLQMPGIDVNCADHHGWRWMHDWGFTTTDFEAYRDGQTPLWYACSVGHLAVARALLRMPGIDVNRAGSHGRTPLHVASEGGHVKIVEALLQMPGIALNPTDSRGQTPLYVACNPRPFRRLFDARVAMMLVDSGAQVNVRDRTGQSPLEFLCRGHGGVGECVRSVKARAGPLLMVVLLAGLSNGMAVNLVMQCMEGWQRVVARLLRAGASVLRRSERILRQRRRRARF